MASRLSLAGLRQQLAAKGFTSLPTCLRCGRQVQPKHWGKDACAECEAAVRYCDDRIQAIDRELTLLWASGRERGTDVQDATDALEIERADLLAILHPENAELGPDGQPVLPERHPPMLDGATKPFLPDED